MENSSCSACVHSPQDTSHLILHCPATDSLCRSLFGDSLSLYDLWSRPWGVSLLLGLRDLPLCHHPSKGSGNHQQQQHEQISYRVTEIQNVLFTLFHFLFPLGVSKTLFLLFWQSASIYFKAKRLISCKCFRPTSGKICSGSRFLIFFLQLF